VGITNAKTLILGRRIVPDATQKGKTHQAAIRALAFKWIRIVFRCWQDNQPYDEVKYLMALKRKGSLPVQTLAIAEEVK
jgi:hypothetical protein